MPPPPATWGHWWNNKFLLPFSPDKRCGPLLHRRFGLYNYAFINTSSAMCSHPSRWLTEGYRGIWGQLEENDISIHHREKAFKSNKMDTQ